MVSPISRTVGARGPERRPFPLRDQPLQGGEPEAERATRAIRLHHQDAALLGPLVERRRREPEHGGGLVDLEQPVGHQLPVAWWSGAPRRHATPRGLCPDAPALPDSQAAAWSVDRLGRWLVRPPNPSDPRCARRTLPHGA